MPFSPPETYVNYKETERKTIKKIWRSPKFPLKKKLSKILAEPHWQSLLFQAWKTWKLYSSLGSTLKIYIIWEFLFIFLSLTAIYLIFLTFYFILEYILILKSLPQEYIFLISSEIIEISLLCEHQYQKEI